MGLTSSLLIGQTALSASQLALQVTGNNIANVGTQGYHRQRVSLAGIPASDRLGNAFFGAGVKIDDVQRILDPAVQARLRNSISDEQSASVASSILDQIESLMGELTDQDLSSQLESFFSAFSELANNPAATSNRASVVEQGAALSTFIRGLRGDLGAMRKQTDAQLSTNVERADAIMTEIASLNSAVVSAELGSGTDGNLRDQRDTLINELAELIDITVIEQDSGAVDILVGSTPVVTGSRTRGLEIDFVTEGSTLEARVQTRLDTEKLKIDSGLIGGLLAERDGTITDTIADLDELAATLIFEVNRLHSSGRPSSRLTDETGTLEFPVPDQSRALNDPANSIMQLIAGGAASGSFEVVITDASGNQSKTLVNIDLDGIDNAGIAGTTDDTSLDDLVASLDAIANLNAEVTADGKLRVYTDAGFDVSFAGDTSGVLAVVGIGTYFTGRNASDIDIHAELEADPDRLSIGLGEGTNETALAIAALRDTGVSTLGGDTISGRWQKTVEKTAVQTVSARTQASAASSVRASLEAQQAAVSGVSLDEESINLIAYQQQYQGAARFISLVSDLTQILLGLV